MNQMLQLAEQRIYVSMCSEVLHLIEDELKDALERGPKVVIITDEQSFYQEAVV